MEEGCRNDAEDGVVPCRPGGSGDIGASTEQRAVAEPVGFGLGERPGRGKVIEGVARRSPFFVGDRRRYNERGSALGHGERPTFERPHKGKRKRATAVALN